MNANEQANLVDADATRATALEEAAQVRPPRSAGKPPKGIWGGHYQLGWDHAVDAFAKAIRALIPLPAPSVGVEKGEELKKALLVEAENALRNIAHSHDGDEWRLADRIRAALAHPTTQPNLTPIGKDGW